MEKLKLFCIIVLTFFIVFEHHVNCESEPPRIFRGDHDTFDNPTCWEGSMCSNCMEMNADCTSTRGKRSGCRECRCSGQYKTYLRHLSKCVRDNSLLFFPVEGNSFLIEQSQKQTRCMTFGHITPNNLSIATCNSSDPSQQWIWTRYNQVLHVETSKCIQQGEAYPGLTNTWYLGLEECNISETRQKWHCDVEIVQRIIKDKNGQENKIFMSMTMFQTRQVLVATITLTNWRRYQPVQSADKVCSLPFGCNEFANPASPILVIDLNCHQQDCQGEQKIAGLPKETNCFVMWNLQSHFLDYNDWKQLNLTEKIFSFSNRTSGTLLKWNLTKVPLYWDDRIIKLSFYCARSEQPNPSSNIGTRCILIKFKKSSDHPTAATSTVSTVLSSKVTTKTSFPDTLKTTNPKNPANSRSTFTTSTPNSEKEQQKDESPSAVGIVVGLLVAVLAICGIILGFCIYKRRSGLDKTSSNVAIHGKGHSSGNTSNPIYSSADINNPSFLNDGGIYQEPGGDVSASQACNLYESADNRLEYDYAKVEQTNKPTPISQEQAYDYANNDDIRSASQRLPVEDNDYSSNVIRKNDENETKKEHETGPVYQTLECE